MTEESSIDGFVEGLKEGGFTDVEVKYIDNKKGGYTRIPAPEGMPMMPMMPQYSANDVKNAAKGADVIRFVRYKMGEGLEKRVDDLAAEVAAQTAGMK
jgi:hypothetical protein